MVGWQALTHSQYAAACYHIKPFLQVTNQVTVSWRVAFASVAVVVVVFSALLPLVLQEALQCHAVPANSSEHVLATASK